MSDAGRLSVEGWQTDFVAAAPQRFENSMRDALEQSGLSTLELVDRLRRVASSAGLAVTPLFRDFVAHVINSMVMKGEGNTAFREDQAFLADATRAVQAISDSVGGTTALWLALARCHANIDNAGRERLASIHSAGRYAIVPDDVVRARTVLAHYFIDTSNYRRAQRLLDQTETEFAGTPIAASHRAELLAARGMCQFYTDPEGSDTWFVRAIAVGTSGTGAGASEDESVQPVATAVHYRGRVAAARGEHQLALVRYVEAQAIAPGRLAGRAFHHVRLAEILLRHGPAHEAEHHLRQADSINQQARQISTGAAQLNHAWAQFHLATGDHRSAERELRDALRAARRANARRSTLQFALALGRLHAGRRRPVHALLYLTLAACWLLRWELFRDRHVVRNLRALMTHAPGALGRARPRAQSDAVRCPCGANHEGSAGPRSVRPP
ncbi:hypothetical protein [Streptomyces sp. NPDC020681]|uniref:hypothetical protein n=1 Tax=Streptomyces sp. NPDC020681 TaxID=3365083 RepID=UPI0037B2F728